LSTSALVTLATGLPLAAEGGEVDPSKAGYVPPSSLEFEYPPIFDSVAWLTKPVLQMFVAFAIVLIFFMVTSRKRQLVPGRLQFAGEGVYAFIRNGVGRDVIGHGFEKFVPLLVTLFAFIYVNNVFGILPGVNFPSMSRIGFPIVLALVVWVVYNYVGIRKFGVYGYFKNMMFPPGVPKPVYILLAPIEFVSTFLVRPVTLALRLFANMFAGHLLLLVFILGGAYMLQNENLLLNIFAIPSFLVGIGLTFFEALIQLLQAYIFTLLTALYIAGALAEEH
jgi:F-type H+-transporting ATPase subunit a